ncbi:MAG: NUDIX domain-containing protein [Candidatus Eisenbacteria sp.]|nr:NUDIX domain-containing protein [Candidatus Eisenbacteria bacterium]
MSLTPLFCSQCGAELERRLLDGRQREMCPACGTVSYRNPLPVAAAVVLNKAREVLLVRRRQEPHRGEWCLPIGFAELDETIAQAALRELREEAGIEGSVLRLLDVDSYGSDYYGDLLIVSFEVAKTGGREAPGDDAEEVAYFPLDGLPPLAFASNERAIAACREVHQDEWAIRDSFARLQSDQPAPASAALLSDALVALIRDHAGEIADAWLEDVRSNPTTPSYGSYDPQELLGRGEQALSQFSRWLRGDEAEQEIRDFYRRLGAQRGAEGFAPHEVVSSLTLLRKHVWLFARRQGMWERPIDVYRVLELDRRLVLFFDRAVYQTIKGFQAGLTH